MELIAPVGPVYQAGTLSGNPLAMAAGIAQLLFLRETQPYAELEQRARNLMNGLAETASDVGVPFHGDAAGAMFGWHFTDGPVHDLATAARADSELFARFHTASLERGVFLPPSPYEAAFLSASHTREVMDDTLDRLGSALRTAAA
jgi:glutamate-1-semialdehyde 2,1-aminomutase